MAVYMIIKRFVDAQIWNGVNMNKMSRFVGSGVKLVLRADQSLKVTTRNGDEWIVKPTEYLIRTGTLQYQVMGIDEFEMTYEKVT